MNRVYLDYNATAPLRPEAATAMAAALGPPANPSSVHAFGQEARHKVEDARQHLADWLGVAADRIIFTSGATEANSQAINAFPDRLLITSPVEHSSLLALAKTHADRGNLQMLRVDANGRIDLNHLETLLRRHQKPALLSLMAANNETGVIQPLAEATALAHSHAALVHSDGVQACDKSTHLMQTSGIDMLSISAHKLGGPSGIGALVLAETATIPPLLLGGGQERGRRAGTENVPGIIGFGAAVGAIMKAKPDWLGRLRGLHDALETRLLKAAPKSVVLGKTAPRLPNTTAIAMPGLLAETQVMAFDLAGIAISAGAACSSGKVAKSHVLEAMGATAASLADCTIRISSGWNSSEADFEACADTWLDIYARQLK